MIRRVVPPRLSILGLGLLGGSVALAARRARPGVRIVGYDPSPDAASSAVARGVIDEATASVAAGVEGSALCVVAAPVGRIAELLRQIGPALPAGAVVTDVGSAKRSIVAAGDAVVPGRFVGAHPMAGGESSGPGAARADLFDGAACVLTPTAATDPAALDAVRAFWRSLGATTIELSPADHDARVAAVSHLPHAVAAAVARAQTPESLAVSGRGYRDTTRIAAGGPALWADILTANADEVAPRLRRLAADLTGLADLLADAPGAGDPGRLAAVTRWLDDARASAGKPPAGRRPDDATLPANPPATPPERP